MKKLLLFFLFGGVAAAHPHRHHHRVPVHPMTPVVCPMPAPVLVRPVVPVVVRPVWIFGQQQQQPTLPAPPQEPPAYREPAPLPELPPAPVEQTEK